MTEQQRTIGVLTTDAELIVRSWDEWLVQATGIAADQARGQPLASFVIDFEVRGLGERFRQVLDEGVVQVLAPAFHHYLIPCPPWRRSPRFERMQQHVTIVPLREGDRVAGTLVMIEDVTLRLEHERDLADQLDSPDEHVRGRALRELAADAQEPGRALAGALDDESWRVRRIAVGGLAHTSQPDVVSTILHALREGHHDLRVLSSTLQVLSLTEADVAAPLIELLGDPDADLRSYAALALGERRDPGAVQALIGALQDSDMNVRYHAIEALGKLAAVKAVEPLLALVRQRDFFLAFPALDALIHIGDARVAPALVPLLEDELLRAPAVDALGQLGDDRTVEPLAALLARPDAPAITIAQAFVALYTRYEELYGEGEHIADMAGQAISDAGRDSLIAALAGAEGDDLATVAQVLGWLDSAEPGGSTIDRLLVALLARPAARQAAVNALARRGRSRGPALTELLIEQLASREPEVRQAAVIALGRIGDDRAVPALTRVLTDDPQLAIIAVGALTRIGDLRAFGTLIGLLGHPDAAARQAVVSAVNSLAHPDLPRLVTELLDHPDPLVRESACKIAGYYGFPECVDRLLACAAGDPEENVRMAAVDHLPYLDDPRVLPLLIEVLTPAGRADSPAGGARGGAVARVRAAAARALGRVESASAVPALLSALEDQDLWVRYFAARSLGHQGGAETLEALGRLSEQDPAPPVRIAAIEAIGEVDGAEAAAMLAPLARSDDRDLARVALGALGRIEHPDALPPLLAALHSADPARQVDAIHAVRERPGGAGPDVTTALLWVATTESDVHVVHLAIDALAHLASPDAVAALIGLAADPRRRDACIPALASLGKEAIPWLARGLGHDLPAVRIAVIEALARMKQPEASEEIGLALDDRDPAVRRAAAVALGQLASSHARARLAALAQSDPDPAVREAAQAALRI